MAALCKANGRSCIEESIFENRFLAVEEFCKMGADIRIRDRMADIIPVNKLVGCEVTAKDLRGGAALVIAALGAEGKSRISNAELIFRGYEDITRDLAELGAAIHTI